MLLSTCIHVSEKRETVIFAIARKHIETSNPSEIMENGYNGYNGYIMGYNGYNEYNEYNGFISLIISH